MITSINHAQTQYQTQKYIIVGSSIFAIATTLISGLLVWCASIVGKNQQNKAIGQSTKIRNTISISGLVKNYSSFCFTFVRLMSQSARVREPFNVVSFSTLSTYQCFVSIIFAMVGL